MTSAQEIVGTAELLRVGVGGGEKNRVGVGGGVNICGAGVGALLPGPTTNEPQELAHKESAPPLTSYPTIVHETSEVKSPPQQIGE